MKAMYAYHLLIKRRRINIKHITIFILFFISSINSYSSTNNSGLCMDNENVIFSFFTTNNKIMSICISKDDSYIVYRYGTKNKIELEYPEDKKDSWSKFKYAFYWRGGGPENEGMDINHLIFSNIGYTYTIYEEYYAVADVVKIGISIMDSKNNHVAEITGDLKSAVGSLIDLKYNENIKKEDLF